MNQGTAAYGDRSIYIIRPAASGSMEWVMANAGPSALFVDFLHQTSEPGNAWMFEPIVAREWGTSPLLLVPREQMRRRPVHRSRHVSELPGVLTTNWCTSWREALESLPALLWRDAGSRTPPRPCAGPGVVRTDPFLAKIIASSFAGCVWLAFLETS